MDGWAYAVVHNLLRKGNAGNGEQETAAGIRGPWLAARRSRLTACGVRIERQKVKLLETAAAPRAATRPRAPSDLHPLSPKGWNVKAPASGGGCRAAMPPPFPPFSPERASRSEAPLAPFQGLQGKQNRAADRYRQPLPWALPRAVTSQPFRLNGHRCQGRRRYDSLNSCAGGGQNRGPQRLLI
jgi:hypothetical protein